MLPRSRHPKINYWFWKDCTLEDKKYLKTLDRIAEDGRFDMLALTDRGCDFWDPTLKEDFRALVDRAHTRGLKIVLQLWPRGMSGTTETTTVALGIDEAGAIALDVEATVKDGKVTLRSVDKWTRGGENAPAIGSEFICAYVFQKTADGFYKDGTLVDATEQIETVYTTPNRVSATLALPEYEGYTVFAVAVHYHRIPDVFSDFMIQDYKRIMDTYADVPFDGIALDEFKGLASGAPHTMEGQAFRGRMFGRAFARIFRERTGQELTRVLLDMRYCPEGHDEIRASAINLYFDEWRRGTTRVENFVSGYSKKIFGENAFLGFHNTYHNNLTNDEIWNTGCNWWEVKRDYAQTDENMVFPVRMGLACQAKEAIIYDMYYHKDKETFFAKAINEAAFGSRIHYHAIDDGSRWGLDTGTQDFLDEVSKYEDAVELLNLFEPTLPRLPLLCVFGFPAQLNWYPNESARAQFDINGSLGFLEKAEILWRAGYLNALAPDDAIVDGRITMDASGRFDYCGHKFDAMLYLYPEYAKPEAVAFLRSAVSQGVPIRVIGTLTHSFDGSSADGSFLADITQGAASDVTVGEATRLWNNGTPIAGGLDRHIVDDNTVAMLCEAATSLGVESNDIENGCRLTDGSVVISHYESLRDGLPYTASFELGGKQYEVSFMGTFAIKTDAAGEIEKLVCAELCELTRNGEPLLPELRGKEILYGI